MSFGFTLKRSHFWKMPPVERLLDWIYPKGAVCMGCDSGAGFDGEWLCEDCRKELAKAWVGAWPDAKLDGFAVAYHYRGPAGGVVRRLKYSGVWALADFMADDMLRACRQIQPIRAELIAAVPMHPKRLRQRGYNQSEVLAKAVAEKINLPFENVLTRTRNTVQQARLSGKERLNNLRDAFVSDMAVEGRRVLLVDDVYTTGTTAHECAIALREAGAKSVTFLAYALGSQRE